MKKSRPTCDQCLYHEHCYDLLDASDCAAYKDKDRFVEFKFKLGDYFACTYDELDTTVYQCIGLQVEHDGSHTVIGVPLNDNGSWYFQEQYCHNINSMEAMNQ